MREEEKIFVGKMSDPRKQELKEIKHRAHRICQKYNALDEYDPERKQLFRELVGSIGKGYYFQAAVQFNYGVHTFIGEHFSYGFHPGTWEE